MKKLISLLLALILVFSMVACGTSNANDSEVKDGASSVTEDDSTAANNAADTNTETEDNTKETTDDTTGSTETAEPEIIYDTNGNAFELPFEINTAIVINSSIYEMICVLGKDDIVIGVGDTVSSPASALEKDKYGDWREPNVEMILEAAPDVVFGYASWLDSGIANQLTEAGIPVVMLNLSNPNEILGEVEFLGKLLGAEDRANAFIADVQGVLNLVAERTADVEPISVYWEGYVDYKTVGQAAGGHELMKLANVSSLSAEETGSSIEISDEYVLEANPQMIVKTVSSTKGIMGETITDPTAATELYNSIAARPGWDGVDAVVNGKVVLLHSRICTTPLGLAICPLVMAKVAYPEKFEDIDPNEYLANMLQEYWGEELVGIWTFID